MKKPIVSIIIPTYNRAQLIKETVDSILAQTYKKWECIIVDDGSTDNTKDVLFEHYNDDTRIQFYSRPEHKPKGANACRNYGLELSNGEFVLFYDSDDVMLEEKIQIHIDLFKSIESLDATVTNSYYYNFKTKKKIKPWREKLTSKALITEFILQKTGWQTGDILWKKEALYNLEFNEILQSSQDWEFHIKALCLDKKLEFKDVCMSYIRHTPKSIKNSFSLKKNQSDFISRKNVVNLTKRKNVLNSEGAYKILKEFYSFFEIFLFQGAYKYAFNTFFEIVKLTLFLNAYNVFFNFFCVQYPIKFFKKIVFK